MYKNQKNKDISDSLNKIWLENIIKILSKIEALINKLKLLPSTKFQGYKNYLYILLKHCLHFHFLLYFSDIISGLMCYWTASVPGAGFALGCSGTICMSGNFQVLESQNSDFVTVRERKGHCWQDEGVSPGQAAVATAPRGAYLLKTLRA